MRLMEIFIQNKRCLVYQERNLDFDLVGKQLSNINFYSPNDIMAILLVSFQCLSLQQKDKHIFRIYTFTLIQLKKRRNFPAKTGNG